VPPLSHLAYRVEDWRDRNTGLSLGNLLLSIWSADLLDQPAFDKEDL
jgi:hypothetical protein